MVAISELQTISSVRSKTIKETSLVAVASYAGHRSLRSLLPASFHTTKSSHMLLHTLREWLHYIVHEQQAGVSIAEVSIGRRGY